MRRYEIQVQEADSEGTRKSCMTTNDLSCATLVHIIFENLEITTFKYTPRYEPIGILSFIGGYVGLWLGISFLTVYDFLDTCIFRFASTFSKKWKFHQGRSQISATNTTSLSTRRATVFIDEFNMSINSSARVVSEKDCTNSTDVTCAILVQTFLENMETTTFIYRPTYEIDAICLALMLAIDLKLSRHCFDQPISFTVQSIKFVEMYLQYPSTVELEVLQPSELEMPAFTVCNINEIRSSVYCKRYPQNCGAPDSYPGFCDRYPSYCKLVNDTRQVPLYLDLEQRNFSRYEEQIFGHQFENLVQTCTVETDDEEENCSTNAVLVPALSFSYEAPFNCYMLYSLHKRPDDKPKVVPISTKVHLTLNLEVPEYHPSHLSRGAQLSIHSPYHVPSPVGEGLFLNMGTVYRIYVRLAEKELLPAPYKSNCTDYEKQWKENGGTGPVTEKMCKEKCKLEMSISLYNCVERRVDYPHNETICKDAHSHFAKMARPICSKRCSSPCRMRRYEIQVQEADSEGTRKSCMTTNDLSCATLVHIIFENLEITTFKYTPRYEPIGILSFIGGYVGLWLGISFLTVYDFLETCISRFTSAFSKKLKFHQGKSQISAIKTTSRSTRRATVLSDEFNTSNKSSARVVSEV